MYKKGIATLAFLVLVASACYAQVPRNASYATTTGFGTVTNFTNISVQGLDTTGNPGFIEMSGITESTFPGSTRVSYFLWIDNVGNLRIASYSEFTNDVTGSLYASWPSGNWASAQMNVGTVVGRQE